MDPGEESSSSGGSSSRRGKTKVKEIVSMLKITELVCKDPVIKSIKLDKPSGVSGAPKWERNVCLNLVTDSHSFNILRLVHHPNILHNESIIKTKGTTVKVAVEKYTSDLKTFLQSVNLINLQKTIRQIIEGVDELRLNGLYHGNLDIDTTYHDKESMQVKLANFKEKADKTVAQSEDWDAVANVVDQISAVLKGTNQNNIISMKFWEIDDLVLYINSLPNQVSINQFKEKALAHVFFWNKISRSSFFIYHILAPLRNVQFENDIGSLDCIPLNWNQDDHEGLLTEMNQYRISKGLKVYGNSRYNYVLFVSGAYTHENELTSLQLGVDEIVTTKCPRLCLELVNLARRHGYVV